MATIINETPEISEDESSREISEDESFEDSGNSLSIIESSLIENESPNTSPLQENKSRRKKAFVIESDSSGDEEILHDAVNENHSEANVHPSTSGIVKQNSPSSDKSNSRISVMSSSFLEGNIHSSTLIQPINSENSTESRQLVLNNSYRNTVPPSRSPSPETDAEVIYLSSSSDETPLSIQNGTTITASKMVENIPHFTILDGMNLHRAKEVTKAEYQNQKAKIDILQFNIQRTKNIQRTINVNSLPDKGHALITKYETQLKELKIEEEILDKMVVSKEQAKGPQPIAWEHLHAGLGSVQPRTFGKQAIETLNVQKALTLDRLEQLHGSLKTCPDSNTLATDPEGLKIELMPHQKHAIAWLLWREKQKPSGGILADDMGLGKTLTMISLTLKSNQIAEEENEDTSEQRKGSKYPGGTLVICPASVVYQWEAEIKKRVKKGLITVGLYHGSTRETKAKRLAQQGIVITTYGLAMSDCNKNGPLYEIKWRRVILDEAHQIRNHKAQTSVAVCNLSAKSRWALTGTPIHNKELDLYALLKFLRCSPFDDLPVWKRWVANKGTGGQDRLNTVMSSLILRRTKQQLAEKKMLNSLPDKTWEQVEIILDKEEMDVYQKVLIFSRTLFAQFLHQRAEKDTDLNYQLINNPNGEYYKMHQQLVKLNRVKKIKQHEILVLLLRLRQICCHPSLITTMLQGEEGLEDSEMEGQEELNLLEQLNKLNIDEPSTDPAAGLSTELDAGVGLGKASRNLLNPSNPVFTENRISSKLKAIFKVIEELPSDDKVIIVSQWTKLLHLLALQFKHDHVSHYQLDGTVPVHKRMEMVDNFNKPSHKTKILLLSLTAGGVGLNLIGANHLILTDLHWNPQLEMQAQDRIYRVGQSKPVKIYKLITVDTIEQRIKQLQEKKMQLAEELLTGAKIQQHNKLSLDDLKMLFQL